MSYIPNDFTTAAVINANTLFQNYDDELQQLMTDAGNYLETEIVKVYEETGNIVTNGIGINRVDNIANLKLQDGLVFNTIEVLGYYAKGDGGGGTFYWDSTSTETDNGGTTIQANGIATGRWKRVFSGAVNVKWFGAKGDGATDDTEAIQNAMNSECKNIYFSNGSYVVSDSNLDGTAVLSSTVDERIFSGDGKITALSQVKKLFSISGSNNVISLNIDGNNNIGYALHISGENPTVENCNIYDLNGFTNYGGIGILFDFDDIDTTATVRNNTIKNLQGEGDGTYSNGVGMQRAITINSNHYYTNKIHVYNNIIEQVEGEEGDAIVVINSDGNGTYYNFPVIIENNKINMWSRRAVKVQAHGIIISNNEFSNNIDVYTGSLQRVVDIVRGGDNTVSFNIFNSCKFQSQIGIYLDLAEADSNYTIKGNIINGIGSETSSPLLVFNTYGDNLLVASNVINCPDFSGVSIFATNMLNAVISNNVISTSASSWYKLTYSTNIKLINNILGNGITWSYENYFDLNNNEFLYNVSSGRALTLYNQDSNISAGETISAIKCRQNDASYPNSVHASIKFVGVGASGATQVEVSTGSGESPDVSKLIVDISGSTKPYADNTYSLGTSTNRWSAVYAGTSTINTSDEREKTFYDIEEAETNCATALKAMMKKFKFNDAISLKGEDEARIHYGVGAQSVIAKMEEYGLTPADYAFICYDEWEEEKDENGNVVIEAGNRYGIRYEELLCFIISAM